jgi:hypothetical protein
MGRVTVVVITDERSPSDQTWHGGGQSAQASWDRRRLHRTGIRKGDVATELIAQAKR